MSYRRLKVSYSFKKMFFHTLKSRFYNNNSILKILSQFKIFFKTNLTELFLSKINKLFKLCKKIVIAYNLCMQEKIQNL